MNNDTDTNISLATDIWTQTVEGTRHGTKYEGDLVLLLSSTGKLRLEARVRKPRQTTVTIVDDLKADTNGSFKISLFTFFYNVAQFRRTPTNVSFSLYLGADIFGRFTIFAGPVCARIPAANELADSCEQYAALLHSIGAEQLASMTSESIPL